jgi:hypothetical protein
LFDAYKMLIEIATSIAPLIDEPPSADRETQWAVLNLAQSNEIKHGQSSPVAVMKLAQHRSCTIREDEIYGLMGASGVIIACDKHDNLDMAWKKWWEQSMRAGNLEFAYMPVLSNMTGIRADTWNCVMPPSEDRCIIGHYALTERAKPWGDIEVQDGTLSLLGKVAGICSIDKYLCENVVPTELDELGKLCGGDLNLAERVCLAQDFGQTPRTKVLERAKCVRAAYRLANDAERLSENEQERLKKLAASYSSFIKLE